MQQQHLMTESCDQIKPLTSQLGIQGKEGTRVPLATIPFKGMTPKIKRPSLMFHFLKVPLPPNSCTLHAMPLAHGTLEDIQHPNYNREKTDPQGF